jgi:hypothetical protein
LSPHQRAAGRLVQPRRRATARRDRTSPRARIIWRPRLGLVGVGAIAILLIAALAFGVLETPDASGPVSDAADSLGDWTYLAIPALAFLETGAFVGLLVPGETAIIAGGVVAERGEVDLPPLIALVWAAAVPAIPPASCSAASSTGPSSTPTARGCRSAVSTSTGSNGSSTATARRWSSSGASSGSCGR